MKKLYPSKKELLKTYGLIIAIIVIILFFILGSKFQWAFKDDKMQYIIWDIITLVSLLAIAIILLLIVWFWIPKKNYYEIRNNAVIHYNFNKEITYDFSNILYIDKEYTLKHKTLLFYNNKGKGLFLILDKDFELYEIMKQKCKNLLSKEEFMARFPSVKL